MKKKALGLNDMAIPGIPYENRTGTDEGNMAISNRFFGKEFSDDKNESALPVVKKTKEVPEDVAYEEDPSAAKYFEYLLKMRSDKKSRRKRK
jgi:hypothetical protein